MGNWPWCNACRTLHWSSVLVHGIMCGSKKVFTEEKSIVYQRYVQ